MKLESKEKTSKQSFKEIQVFKRINSYLEKNRKCCENGEILTILINGKVHKYELILSHKKTKIVKNKQTIGYYKKCVQFRKV